MLFKCSVCDEELKRDYKVLKCKNNHTFDIAKEGYSNLISGHKKSKYDKKLFTARREVIEYDNEPIDQAKSIVNEYFSRNNSPKFTRKVGVPCYIPSEDRVCMPKINDFINSEEYYSTFFHEMVHSTGHNDRLKREAVNKKISFGNNDYSKEELVAEIGASILSAEARIDTVTIDNSASYIDNWLQQLRNDKI